MLQRATRVSGFVVGGSSVIATKTLDSDSELRFSVADNWGGWGIALLSMETYV